MITNKKTIEVSFTTENFKHFQAEGSIAVVVDILRASSAICTAFLNGVNKIIPVGSLEEARKFKEKGYMVACERDGVVQDFADFGNSPFNFTVDKVKGKDIVYSTTNGTRAIQDAGKRCKKVLIGSFLNINSLSMYLGEKNENVIILCAGWKAKFSLEDTVFAGALARKLLNSGKFETTCDSTLAAIDLWTIAQDDLVGYIDKAANRHRLKKLGLDDVIEYCHTPGIANVIPILEGEHLVNKEIFIV